MAASATTVRHLAIVMDGNGRWAQKRGKPRTYGHQAGTEAARRVVQAAADRGIRHLTLFAFSSENWRRPQHEVRRLMSLFRRALDRETDRLHEHGVRIRFIGRRDAFSRSIRAGMQRAEQLTRGNDRLILNIAASYGGRDEIVTTARTLATQVQQGLLKPEDIDELRFDAATALAGQPEPDLLIRTGGERRLSNFLLWSLAYTELYFCETLWPDFGEQELDLALADFAARERRFGTVPQGQVSRHA